jgi:hypothetical protein
MTDTFWDRYHSLHAPWNFTQGDERNPSSGTIRDARGHLLNLRATVNDEDRAVMQAMAAAPEMMAALRAILFQVCQGKVLERDACIAEARAALAKATA